MPGFSRSVSVTGLSWFAIALMAIVPPLVALLVACPFWRKSRPIVGNLAGSVVIFGSALMLILRESVELDRLTRLCMDAGYFCFPTPSRFLSSIH